MNPSDVYCPIKAWKRLKKQGYTPSESYRISKEVYKKVKQCLTPKPSAT